MRISQAVFLNLVLVLLLYIITFSNVWNSRTEIRKSGVKQMIIEYIFYSFVGTIK